MHSAYITWVCARPAAGMQDDLAEKSDRQLRITGSSLGLSSWTAGAFIPSFLTFPHALYRKPTQTIEMSSMDLNSLFGVKDRVSLSALVCRGAADPSRSCW